LIYLDSSVSCDLLCIQRQLRDLAHFWGHPWQRFFDLRRSPVGQQIRELVIGENGGSLTLASAGAGVALLLSAFGLRAGIEVAEALVSGVTA
jgi:hypothetical protein